MYSNLQDAYLFQQLLTRIGYPDYKRISLEIAEYIGSNPDIKRENIEKRLLNGEPWEYIRGYAEFCNLQFLVTKDTLIPRVETEKLVHSVIEIIKKENIKRLVDVGTGTGCIPISVKKYLGEDYVLNIHATDISQSALKIAKRNEELITRSIDIDWLNTNLIKDVEDLSNESILTANLPYIPTEQYLKLDHSVINYEPREALDGGKDGLKLYRDLFKMMNKKNYYPKYLFIETEESIYEKTYTLIKEFFKVSEITKQKDCFERDRFLIVKTPTL